MLIQTFPSGPFSTNAYLVACLETKKAAIIDPAPDSFKSIQAYLKLNPLEIDKILLTHSHWDHIVDVSVVKQKTHALVYIHSLDTPNLEQPGADQLPHWIPFPSVKPDVLLNEGDILTVGHLHFTVIHTPGHSPGGVCFYEPEQHILFSGDTLFKGTIGNLSFPTCQPELMWTSLNKLSKLPLQTIVYPGHGSKTTIGAESWLPRAKDIFG